MKPVSQDVRIPADPADFETTQSRSALPPVEFSVVKDVAANIFVIQDREYPAQRAPTVSYRIYYLLADIGLNWMAKASARLAGQKMAFLVTEVQAPGRGTLLSATDTQFFGIPGFYYCVGVSRRGLEAPPEHMVPVP